MKKFYFPLFAAIMLFLPFIVITCGSDESTDERGVGCAELCQAYFEKCSTDENSDESSIEENQAETDEQIDSENAAETDDETESSSAFDMESCISTCNQEIKTMEDLGIDIQATFEMIIEKETCNEMTLAFLSTLSERVNSEASPTDTENEVVPEEEADQQDQMSADDEEIDTDGQAQDDSSNDESDNEEQNDNEEE